MNGDGYADVIVGARLYDAGLTDEGAAFVFLGSASGVADGSPSTPGVTVLDSNQQASDFGRSVAGAGDVNGDGYGDVIVGANAYDAGLGAAGRGIRVSGQRLGDRECGSVDPRRRAARLGPGERTAGPERRGSGRRERRRLCRRDRGRPLLQRRRRSGGRRVPVPGQRDGDRGHHRRVGGRAVRVESGECTAGDQRGGRRRRERRRLLRRGRGQRELRRRPEQRRGGIRLPRQRIGDRQRESGHRGDPARGEPGDRAARQQRRERGRRERGRLCRRDRRRAALRRGNGGRGRGVRLPGQRDGSGRRQSGHGRRSARIQSGDLAVRVQRLGRGRYERRRLCRRDRAAPISTTRARPTRAPRSCSGAVHPESPMAIPRPRQPSSSRIKPARAWATAWRPPEM